MYEYRNYGYYPDDSPNDLRDTSMRTLDTAARTPTHKQNGGINFSKHHLSQSKHSLNMSRRSLNLSKLSLYGKDYGVQKSLASLGLLAVLSTVLAILGVQMILTLTAKQNTKSRNNGTMLHQDDVYESILEVTVALSVFVVMLNFSCLIVCSLQCYFATKILKVPQGEERAFKYLKESAATRFISACGFFISIPAYLLAFLLFMVMEFRVTPAIISTAILGVGVIFCIIAVVQNTYYWRVEKERGNKNMPVFDYKHLHKNNNDPLNGQSTADTTRSELSTLV